MEDFIQIIVVINFIAIGLSMAFRPHLWIEWVNNIQEKGVPAMLSLGMIYLFMGSIIVSFHWIWEGLATIITIIGVLIVCESCLILIMPRTALKILNALAPKFNCIIPLEGTVLTLIGILLLYDLEVTTGLLPKF